jgi:hypothetical protein
MSTSTQTRTFLSAAVGIPLLLAATMALQARIDAKARWGQESDTLLLSSPSAVKNLSLGYDALLADIYWTRAVQYYGDRIGTAGAKFDLLWPLLDITTTLDPKLIVAYRFGAIFLSEPGGVGAGRTDLAVELVKRGIEANPNEWRLYSDLGFLYYWRLKDFPDSAEAYLQGSKNPDAPPFLKMMAARVAEKGGSIETSRIIWSELYATSKDPSVRSRAEMMLQALKAQDDESHLNELSDTYQKRVGKYPSTTADLRSAGMLNGIPVDPKGYAYVFGLDGKAQLDPHSPVVIPPEPTTATEPNVIPGPSLCVTRKDSPIKRDK